MRGFAFKTGYFSGLDAAKTEYDKSSWALRARRQGVRQGGSDAREPPLRVPAPEEALLPLHAGDGGGDLRLHGRGVPESAAEIVTSTGTPDRPGTIIYALGWTQHSQRCRSSRRRRCCSSCSATWAARAEA